jgi:hypothetical protein
VALRGRPEAVVSVHGPYYRDLAGRLDISQPGIAKHTANPFVADLEDGLAGESKALHERPSSENAFIVPWLKSHLHQLARVYLCKLSRQVFTCSREEAFAWD